MNITSMISEIRPLCMNAVTIGLSLIFDCGIANAQKMYSVDNEYRADIKVYVVDSEYKADLVVYKTDKAYKAKSEENNGIWYFCPYQYQADKKIFFVDREYQADIKVYFTDKEYRAGWKKSKKPLLY